MKQDIMERPITSLEDVSVLEAKLMQEYGRVLPKKHSMPKEFQEQVERICEEYAVPPYLYAQDLKALFVFETDYSSTLCAAEENLQNCEAALHSSEAYMKAKDDVRLREALMQMEERVFTALKEQCEAARIVERDYINAHRAEWLQILEDGVKLAEEKQKVALEQRTEARIINQQRHLEQQKLDAERDYRAAKVREKSKSRRKKWILILASTVTLCAMFVIGFLFFTKSGAMIRFYLSVRSYPFLNTSYIADLNVREWNLGDDLSLRVLKIGSQPIKNDDPDIETLYVPVFCYREKGIWRVQQFGEDGRFFFYPPTSKSEVCHFSLGDSFIVRIGDYTIITIWDQLAEDMGGVYDSLNTEAIHLTCDFNDVTSDFQDITGEEIEAALNDPTFLTREYYE